MIGESAPQGLDVSGGDLVWLTWYQPYFHFIDAFPVIKAFCYINWNWANYPEWSTWGNGRIQDNPIVLANFQAELRQAKYIHAK